MKLRIFLLLIHCIISKISGQITAAKHFINSRIESILNDPVPQIQPFYGPFKSKIFALYIIQNIYTYQELIKKTNNIAQFTFWDIFKDQKNSFANWSTPLLRLSLPGSADLVQMMELVPPDTYIAGAIHYGLYPPGGFCSTINWCYSLLQIRMKLALSTTKSIDIGEDHSTSLIHVSFWIFAQIEARAKLNIIPAQFSILEMAVIRSFTPKQNRILKLRENKSWELHKQILGEIAKKRIPKMFVGMTFILIMCSLIIKFIYA